MKIQSKQFVFNPFQENTYLIYDEEGNTIIIDPGMYGHQEEKELDDFISENDLKVRKIVLTHAHIDHVLGLNHCISKYGNEVWMHADSKGVLDACPQVASMYGFQFHLEDYNIHWIDAGDRIDFDLEVIFLPGHAPGHVVLYKEDQKEIWGGDVLFYGSIGRTDLPGGDHELLITGIKEKLFPLPEDVIVHSGHGPDTNIGFEKAK